MFRGIFKQHYIGKQWGTFAQSVSQGAIFITLLNLFLLSATAYNTTLRPWFELKNIDIPYWLFLAVMLILILFGYILLWKFAVPSFYKVFTEQFYREDSLLRQDIELIKKDNKLLKKDNKKILNILKEIRKK